MSFLLKSAFLSLYCIDESFPGHAAAQGGQVQKKDWESSGDLHHKNPDPHASTNVYWRTV